MFKAKISSTKHAKSGCLKYVVSTPKAIAASTTVAVTDTATSSATNSGSDDEQKASLDDLEINFKSNRAKI